MTRTAAIVLMTLWASPALAGASPWQEVAPGVTLRLISSDVLDGGVATAGLEIDMPEGTNTYWRIPGETGIPTQFDFGGSTGIEEPEVLWPYPEIDTSRGYLDYAYYGPVVLPFEMAAEQAGAVLNVSVTLGICSEICVPASASLSLPLNFAAPDAAQSIRLEQAIVQVPILWDQPGQPFGSIEAGLDGSLHLLSPHPSVDPSSVIADVGDPAILFKTPQKSPDNGLWTLKPLGNAAREELDGRPVQLTFLTADGPYAVTRMVAPSQP